MKKRGVVIVLLLITILASAFFVSAQETQIKKAYSWLSTKVTGKWNALDTKQHVFSLLALQEKLTTSQKNTSLKALLVKSKDNTCWPQNSCNPLETAIALVAINYFSRDFSWLSKSDEKVSEWLLNKTIVFIPSENFYLQIVQPAEKEILCMVSYEKDQNIEACEIKVKSDDKIELQNICSCFSAENYWLKIKTECVKKVFSLTCNESALASFLFKKDNEWFVTSSAIAVPVPPLNASLNITSYCIGESTCDYEATLWTAYVFSQKDMDKTRMFLPYLIMQAEAEKKFLPEAFLYAITKKEVYAEKIAALQGNDGFILASGSAYNKYYDSAIAKLLNAIEKANETKLKERLLKEQKTDGSWSCSGLSNCNEIRENALIIYAFWPSYLSLLPECEQQGFTCTVNCTEIGGKKENYDCNEGKECCNLNSYRCEERYGICTTGFCPTNYVKVPYTCEAEQICCKPYNISACVSEIGGKFCQANQECTGIAVVSAEYPTQARCCIGNCSELTQTCSQLNGEICEPPLSCPYEKRLLASDTLYCCMKNFCMPSEQQRCSQQNGRICSAEESCTGTFVVASDTQGMATCCIDGICIRERCKAEDKLCERDETCIDGKTYESAEGTCCSGVCVKKCSALKGVPCNATMICKGRIVKSSDFSRCCIGKCEKKAGFPFWIIIIIAIVAIAAFYFFFIRKKPKEEKEEFLMFKPTFPPRPTLPALPTLTLPTLPSVKMPKPMPKPIKPVKIPTAQPEVKPSKPEVKKAEKKEKSELEKTLEKLRKMTKK